MAGDARVARVADAREFFKDHHAEIRRRAAVAEMPVSSEFEPAVCIGDDPPFVDDEQRWVVFSLSHVQMPPICTDPRSPAIRIYGCFPDAASAAEYAHEVVVPNAPGCSVMVDMTHKWILACKSAANMADPDHVASKSAALLRAHEAAVQRGREAFEADKRQMQSDGRLGGAKPDDGDDDDDDDGGGGGGGDCEGACAADASKRAGRAAARSEKPLSRECELAGQSCVAVSFVQDVDATAPEFLFYVYGAFATDVQADQYVRNVASKRVLDHDIDVILTLRWIFPTTAPDLKTVYRSSELTKIIDHQRSQPAKVRAFEQEMEQYQKEKQTRCSEGAEPSSEHGAGGTDAVEARPGAAGPAPAEEAHRPENVGA